MTLLHRSRKVVMEAGKQYGSALEDVEDSHRTDHNMVMRQSGRALVHTGPRLQADLKIVLADVDHASQHRLHSALPWSLGQQNRDGLEFQENVFEVRKRTLLVHSLPVISVSLREPSPYKWLSSEAVRRAAHCA